MRYIIAGNRSEYLKYLAQTRTKDNIDATYVVDGRSFRGVIDTLVLFGSWYERDDVNKLVKKARVSTVEVVLTRKEIGR